MWAIVAGVKSENSGLCYNLFVTWLFVVCKQSVNNSLICIFSNDLCWKQSCYGLEGGITKAKQGTTGQYGLWSVDQGWQPGGRSTNT